MMTLKIWRALNDPPATHPIFVRTVLLPRLTMRRYITSASLLINSITSMSEFLPTLLVFLMPFLLALTGLVYGLDCTMRISQLITFERKNNTYPLLILCPPGALGACWALATSVLYRQRQFSRLSEIVRISVQIALGTVTIALVLFLCVSSSAMISQTQLTLSILTPLVNIDAVIILIYTEYVQSTVIGCLVGLIIPTFSNGVMDAFLYAPATFLFIKFGCYVISLLIGFSLLDSIYQQMNNHTGLIDILLTVTRVVMIILVQDVVIRLLWQFAIKRMETVAADVELALYPHAFKRSG